MIDFHSHLDLYPNPLNILHRVNEENRFTLTVTTSPKAWIATSQVFSGYKNIHVSLGLHPEIVNKKYKELDLLLTLIPETPFIGEVGIDGSPRYSQTLNKQTFIFEKIIYNCETAGGRIISIHSRKAESKILSILDKYPGCGKPVLHWFSGSMSDLQHAIELGCFFSINPIMAASKKGKEFISRIPPEKILPESDGPFASIQNKPIMPWEAIKIVPYLSKYWSVSPQTTKKILLENLHNILS